MLHTHTANRNVVHITTGLVFITLLAACDKSPVDDTRTSDSSHKPVLSTASQSPTLVASHIVGTNPTQSTNTLLLNGRIEARIQTPVSFEVNGQVQKTTVEVGDRVTKGALLAKVADQDYRINASMAADRVSQAKVRLRYLNTELSKMRPLIESGALARMEYDKLVADKEQAQLQVQETLKQTSAQQLQINRTQLYAPHSGVVSVKNIAVGQFVSIGQPAFMILDTNTLELQVEMPSSVVDALSDWNATVQAVDKGVLHSYPLTLQRVAAQSTGNSANYQVTYYLPTALNKQKAGEVLAVKLQHSPAPNSTVDTLSIPAAAVIQTGDKAYVWRVDGSTTGYRVISQPVQILAYQGAFVRVAGLTAGMRIVSAGANQLTNHQAVQLLPVDPLTQPTAVR